MRVREDFPMNCDNCGACCMNQLIPLNALERRTTPKEDMDGRGNLRRVNGHCIRFDPETRRCTDYENRPEICRDFRPGCGSCHVMRLWAEVELDWFGVRPRLPVTELDYSTFTEQLFFVDCKDWGILQMLIPKEPNPRLDEPIARVNAALPDFYH